jgi:hypothetical protein
MAISALRSTPALGVVAASLAIFAIAAGARLLHWQDGRHAIETAHRFRYRQPVGYQRDALRLLADPSDFPFVPAREGGQVAPPVHPPGYPIFIAAVFSIAGISHDALRLAQLLLDAAMAVLAFLALREATTARGASAGALLVACSPQLSAASLVLLPDSVAAVPIVLAIVALLRARRTSRAGWVVAAGIAIGLSCWLRSNALLFAPFLACTLVPALFAKGERARYAGILVLTTLAAILPVTLRHYVVHSRFVPLSLGAGVTLVEGIGDFDGANRFGMPRLDDEVAAAEARAENRPEYARSIWSGDAIARDRARFRRGLEAIASDPLWFAGVAARRAPLMVRYNDGATYGWPADSSHAPIVSASPAFGHDVADARQSPLVWSQEGASFTNARSLGASSRVESATIDLSPDRDYLFRLPFALARGEGWVEIVDDEGRMLGHHPIDDRRAASLDDPRMRRRDRARNAEVEIPFAIGRTGRVRVVVASGGSGLDVALGDATIREAGPTPNGWTRLPRAALRAIERNCYGTSALRAAMLVGLLLLAARRRFRAIAVLAAVPVYYMLFQSAFHTEYRYVLAIHPFLFGFAGVALDAVVAHALAASTAVARTLRGAPRANAESVG